MPTLTDLRMNLDSYWSQSRINTFLMCSLKYAFRYVYKEEPEHTASALPFGNAVHRTLEMMSRTQMDGKAMTKQELQDLFRVIWDRQVDESVSEIRYKDGEDKEMLADKGTDMVGVFRDSLNEDEEILSVSQALAVPLQGVEAPLIGEIDMLVSNSNGQPVIVDWKTSARKWGSAKAHGELQPTALIYCYKQQYGEMPAFEYRIVTKAKTPVYQQACTVRDETHLTRFDNTVRAVDRAVRGEAFIPSDGCWACKDCEFAAACKAWGRKNARA